MRSHLRLVGDLDAGARALARALGVTRVARLTGLDRTGVEVASAVRPGGHVLQVTNGKGTTFAQAARGALCEAAELWAAERSARSSLGGLRAAEVRARVGPGVRVLGHADLGEVAGDVRGDWIPARLLGGGPALVPADAVHCPPAGGPLRPAWSRWTSNGMGAHRRRDEALLHGLLEAVERDRLARALPEGFTEGAAAARLLDPRSLPGAAPRAAALRAALLARGFRVHLLDLTAASARGPGLPAAAAVIVDEEGGPVPVAAGYACRLGRDAALTAALLEAAQSRATEIHGAREDVAFGDRGAARPLAALLEAARPGRSAGHLPDLRARSAAGAVELVARRLARCGVEAAAVELDAPGGLRVIKVLAPGLLLSELLC